MCCARIPANPEDTVGECPECGSPIDAEGDSTLEGCEYSPVICSSCGDRPCDSSC